MASTGRVPTLARAFALLVAFGLAGPCLVDAAPATAAESHCSHDTLAIDATSVSVTVCGTFDGKAVAVTSTFASKTASFNHASSIDVSPGEASSRGIDDVSLVPLGIAKTLHMTLRYKAPNVQLEHALLLPGAVPLK